MTRLHTRIVFVLALAAGIAFLIAFTGNGAQAQGAPALPVRSRLAEADARTSGRSAASPGSPSTRTTTSGSSIVRTTCATSSSQAEIGDRRLLRAAAVDDPHRQERQRHRLVRSRRRGTAWTSTARASSTSAPIRSASTIRRAARCCMEMRAPNRSPAPAAAARRRLLSASPAAGAPDRSARSRSRVAAVAVAAMPTRPPRRRRRQRSRRGARSIRRRRPMIVGQVEEIRLDEPADEVYVADSSFGGRVMVFDLKTFAFKRGWGAYGHRLTRSAPTRPIAPTNRADRCRRSSAAT